jgi:hypothetical protein
MGATQQPSTPVIHEEGMVTDSRNYDQAAALSAARLVATARLADLTQPPNVRVVWESLLESTSAGLDIIAASSPGLVQSPVRGDVGCS